MAAGIWLPDKGPGGTFKTELTGRHRAKGGRAESLMLKNNTSNPERSYLPGLAAH